MQLKFCSPDPEYADLFLHWRQEEAARRYNPLRDLGLQELRELLSQCRSDLTDLKEKSDYRWFVKADGTLVGQVALYNVSLSMKTAEIGYTIAEAHQGKGFGGLAVKHLLRQAFAQTDLRRLFAFVHQGNLPSCRLLERLGFVREGLLREHYLINGEPANEVVFGLLRSEWKDGK